MTHPNDVDAGGVGVGRVIWESRSMFQDSRDAPARTALAAWRPPLQRAIWWLEIMIVGGKPRGILICFSHAGDGGLVRGKGFEGTLCLGSLFDQQCFDSGLGLCRFFLVEWVLFMWVRLDSAYASHERGNAYNTRVNEILEESPPLCSATEFWCQHIFSIHRSLVI